MGGAVSLEDTLGGWAIEESVLVAAEIDAVWALVADPTRIGEFSPECVHAEWLDGAVEAAVGACFAGTNRLGDDEWTRVCTVTTCVPQEAFGYVVGDRFDGSPASEWSFTLSPVDGMTQLTQRFHHLPDGRTGIRLAADKHPENVSAYIVAREERLRAGMRATLQGMKGVLEGTR